MLFINSLKPKWHRERGELPPPFEVELIVGRKILEVSFAGRDTVGLRTP